VAVIRESSLLRDAGRERDHVAVLREPTLEGVAVRGRGDLPGWPGNRIHPMTRVKNDADGDQGQKGTVERGARLHTRQSPAAILPAFRPARSIPTSGRRFHDLSAISAAAQGKHVKAALNFKKQRTNKNAPRI